MRFDGLILFFSGVLASLAIGWFAFPAILYRSEPQPMQFNHAIHTGEQNGMTCDQGLQLMDAINKSINQTTEE